MGSGSLNHGRDGQGFHRMVSSGADAWDIAPTKEVFEMIFNSSANQIFGVVTTFDIPQQKAFVLGQGKT